MDVCREKDLQREHISQTAFESSTVQYKNNQMNEEEQYLERMLQEADRLAQEMRRVQDQQARVVRGEKQEEESAEVYKGVLLELDDDDEEDLSSSQEQQNKPPISVVIPDYSSRDSVSSSQKKIAGAIQAAEEMKKALRSLQERPTGSESYTASTIHASNTNIGSHETTPTNRRLLMESPTSGSYSTGLPPSLPPPPGDHHLSTPHNSSFHSTPYASSPNDKIKWDRLSTPDQKDQDYVAVADYSRKDDLVPVMDYSANIKTSASIQWEKVDTAEPNDDDYVPLADYSKQSPTRRLYETAEEDLTTARALKLQHARKKRKQKLRMMVAASVGLVLALVYGGYHHRSSSTTSTATLQKDTGLSTNPPSQIEREAILQPVQEILTSQKEVSGEMVPDQEEEDEAFESDEYEYEGYYEEDDYEQEEVEYEEDDDEYEEESDDDGYEYEDEKEGHRAAFTACDIPLAWLTMPQCDERPRAERLESLLEAMMQ